MRKTSPIPIAIVGVSRARARGLAVVTFDWSIPDRLGATDGRSPERSPSTGPAGASQAIDRGPLQPPSPPRSARAAPWPSNCNPHARSRTLKEPSNPCPRNVGKVHAEVASCGPCGSSCYLPFKVLALLSTRHTSVYDAHPSTHGDPGWSMRIRPPTQVATTGSFPSRNHRYTVTASTPFTKAHSLKSTITYQHSPGRNG